MKNAPLGHALFSVTPWLVLALGVFYAYLATLGGRNVITSTIVATALITTSICVFGTRFSRAVDTQAREARERRERDTAALIAESRERRRDLAAEDTRTPSEVAESIERLMDDAIRKLR